MKVLWSAVAERSGDTAFIFAQTRIVVLKVSRKPALGRYKRADIATQSGVAASLCHRTP